MQRTEKKEVCSTMLDFLRRMAPGDWNSRKTGAVLIRFRSTPPELNIKESFDSGKSGSNALWSTYTATTEELFVKAVAERYISGKLEPGYVSQWEFLITKLGKQVYEQKQQLAFEILKKIPPDNGVRLCDLQPQFPDLSEEEIRELLDELTRRGYVVSYEKEGEPVAYLRVRTRLVA